MMYNNSHIRYRVITPNGEYICFNLTQASGYCNCSVNKLNKSFVGCKASVNGCVVIRETNDYRLANSGNYEYRGIGLVEAIVVLIFTALLSIVLLGVML